MCSSFWIVNPPPGYKYINPPAGPVVILSPPPLAMKIASPISNFTTNPHFVCASWLSSSLTYLHLTKRTKKMSTKGRPGLTRPASPHSTQKQKIDTKSRKSPGISGSIATNTDPNANSKNVRQPKAIVKNLDDKDLVSSVVDRELHFRRYGLSFHNFVIPFSSFSSCFFSYHNLPISVMRLILRYRRFTREWYLIDTCRSHSNKSLLHRNFRPDNPFAHLFPLHRKTMCILPR